MKNYILTIAFILVSVIVYGQNPNANPQKANIYLNKIGEQFDNIRNQSLSYQSAAARSKRKRLIERERKELNAALVKAKATISRMDCYESNCIIRDTVLYCLDLTHKMYKEEYDKIIDMEEIAEQSYDAMEAYMNAQQAADAKVDSSYKIYNTYFESFCKENNINIIESKSIENKKMEDLAKVNEHLSAHFLNYFRGKVQENHFIEAMNNKDVAKMQQHLNAMKSAVDISLAKINEIPTFKNDESIKNIYLENLNLLKEEANSNFQKCLDFYLLIENFEKTKSSFENKKKSEMTNEDISAFNKAAQEYNKEANLFNRLNTNLNTQRTRLDERLENVKIAFRKRHTPLYKD